MQKQTTDFRIIRGTCKDVEEQVQYLLDQGYTLNGPLYPYSTPSVSDNQTLFAQCVIKNTENSND